MTELAERHARIRRHAQDSQKNRRVPSLRLHKASGRAYVVLNGKAVYCGAHGTPEAEAQYHQVIAEWLAAGQQLPADPETLTIKEMAARFWVHAEQYYRTLTDGRVKELEQFRLAFRPLVEIYALTPASKFGPRALKAVRQKMIDAGWCRPYINKQLNRIRHIFRWAVSDELLSGSVLHALQAVSGLRKGRGDAAEPEAVKPVAMDLVDPIQPFVSKQVWAMVQLQALTGARAGELTRLRPCDVDRSGEIWVYQPEEHKTAHHDRSRTIYIGPRAQDVLAPFLLRDPQTFCFSPAEAVEAWRQQAFENRRTPLAFGNSAGTNRRERPKWTPGERYTTDAYRIAIARGCDRAFPPPAPLGRRDDETVERWRARLTPEQKAELRRWRKAHRWHPHQLRHAYATRVRKDFGLEEAQILLGHAKADVTQVYAQRDADRALDVAKKIG